MKRKTEPQPISFEDFKASKSIRDLFETDVCSRCHGTGKYSFNLVDLDLCYGCNGTGWKYTKRGAKQYQYYKDAQLVPVLSVEIGQKIEFERGKWMRVESMEPWEQMSHRNGERTIERGAVLTGKDGKVSLATVGVVRVARSWEENYEIYKKALVQK